MKHTFLTQIGLLTLFFTSMASFTFAQTKMGVKFVGKPIYIENLGNLNGTAISGQVISASIYGGYFVKNDLAVGAGIKSTQSIVSLIKNPTAANSNVYGFARQYFKTPVRNLKVYGEAQLAYNMNYIPGLGTGNMSQDGLTALQNTLGVGLSPGVSYFLGNRVSADMFLSGLQIDATKIKNLQWQEVLPRLSNVGVGVAGTFYF